VALKDRKLIPPFVCHFGGEMSSCAFEKSHEIEFIRNGPTDSGPSVNSAGT
jgi:hypothetical protein